MFAGFIFTKEKTKMNEKEYLKEIKEMIEKLCKLDDEESLKILHDMVDFKMDYKYDAELDRLRDIFYFLCGIMFEKRISKTWNGT